MANIYYALPPLYRNEGGYSNDPSDSGGETYRGISRRNWPNWEGWSIVDMSKPLHDEEVIPNDKLNQLVDEFYLNNFWNSNYLNKVNSDIIACKVLDMCVNMGSHRGITLLQEALDVCGISVNEDGAMGPVTYMAVNECDENQLHQAIKDKCVQFYKDLVVEHPQDNKFLDGWLRRANQ